MRLIVLSVCLVLALVSVTACAPKEEAHQKDARHVETAVVKAASTSDAVSTTGEIKSRVQSDLSFRVNGRIVERLVDIGDHVRAGQVLARIDAKEQKADLQVALASLQSAQSQQTEARQAFERQQRLFATGVATRAALDQAQEEFLTGQGTVQSAQAQVDTAQDALDQAELKADADGIITARGAEVGQVAQAAGLVFTLAHDGPRDAVINADESVLLRGELGRDVQVRMLSGGDAIKATVREVSPAIDPETGTIQVKFTLEGADDVPLGSPVIVTARYKPTTTIELPWSAMSSMGGKPAAWVVNPNTNAVSLRKIEVLSYATHRFSVRSGVAEGEVVVITGTKFLADGEIVVFEETYK